MTVRVRFHTIGALVVLLTGTAALPVWAQGPSQPASPAAAAPLPVDALFRNATAEEAAVRRVLAQSDPQPTVLKAVRTTIADYEAVVRHYPSSGYSDDALWRAAILAKDAFTLFHEARERNTAIRLLTLLASEYPSSRLARTAPTEAAALKARAAEVVASPAGDAVTPTSSAAASRTPSEPAGRTASAAVAGGPGATGGAATPAATAATADTSNPRGAAETPLATIRAIRRAVLKDVVRVVIELDTEVAFRDERLENPSRVFVDLPLTRASAALLDQTLRFDADTEPVRQVRVGRHPGNTTRVVLETAGVSSYSVYPLYSPYRLVIDCLKEQPLVAAAATTAAPAAPPLLPPPPAKKVAPTPVSRPAPAAAASTAAAAPPRAIPPAIAPVAGPSAGVATLAAAAVAAPPLASRAAAWLTPLPAAAASVLQTAESPTSTVSDRPAWAAPGARAQAPLPSTPTVPARPAPLPSGQPSQNLDGGLSIARQLGLGVSRIVIDPGHGGHDPGAKGAGITESELVLDIALRLEKLLGTLPGVEVVLTRRDDTFVSLKDRTAIANREGADLFLSIHANASSAASVGGVETYFLDFASNQRAAAVAARENATSGQTMGALQDVVKAITLNNKLDESRDFATYVQREMMAGLRNSSKTIKDLGVKKAPFVVLIGASMPSVLAEVSFLTNPQEARLLKGNSYRQRIAQALFEGVKKYQASLKSASTVAQQ